MGYFTGAGVCVYKRIVKQDAFCARCRSEQIVIQLSWIFDHVWDKPQLVAYLATGKKKGKKNVRSRKRRD